jgi:hypothetical protein
MPLIQYIAIIGIAVVTALVGMRVQAARKT